MAIIPPVRPLLTGRDRDDQGKPRSSCAFWGDFREIPTRPSPSLSRLADCSHPNYSRYGKSPEGDLSAKSNWYLALWGLAFLLCVPVCAQQPTEQPRAPQTQAGGDDQPSNADPEPMLPHFHDTRFWLSGQANFIFQAHPDCHAPYSGKNSLTPRYEKATSRVMTLYTGVRLNDSTELLVDIEEAGGAALSTGLGVAGAPDLDIVHNPLLGKAPYLGRGMIHKVFALSEDKVENDRSFLSLFDELPRRHLEIRFGKFSMPDFFDVNSVGTDTHFQFMNWAVDNNGAWDYAADTRGYTVGVVADYEDHNWASASPRR